MDIIDTHTHLNDKNLLADIDGVVERAKEAGVRAVFNNGDSLASFDVILSLQRQYPGFCYSVIGIHPEFATRDDSYLSEAFNYIREHKDDIKAVGEIGLDYHYGKDPELVAAQKKVFIEQIRIAKKLDLPIVIHSRDADRDTFDIIKQERPPRFDLHCYSGSYELLKEYLRLGLDCHIGVGGVLTFKNARVLKEVVSNTDISVFLTETDAPYLAPTPFRGQRNEPSYLPYIIREIASLKGIDEEEAGRILYNNGVSFYGI